MHVRATSIFFAASCLLATACNDHPLKRVQLTRTVVDEVTVDIAPLRNVDILFVIDNSGSMAVEQATIAANFESFIAQLEREDVAADYRIAVTTTDTGSGPCGATGPENGNFIASSCLSRIEEFETLPNFVPYDDARDEACRDLCPAELEDLATTPTALELGEEEEARPWLENIAGNVNLPDGVSTAQAFACMGPQGLRGCGYESPLDAMETALIRMRRRDENEFGFLRDDAILLVVIVTDEADCSVAPGAPGELFSQDDKAAGEVCWHAGVSCSETPDGSLDCTSANLDLDGNMVDGDDALLVPVEHYVAVLEEQRQHKKDATGLDLDVMVSVIAGVPSGYPSSEIRYSEGSTFSDEFGVDPGCSSERGEAVPPVRLLEFADAFAEETPAVSSICDADYTPALNDVLRALVDRFEPACSDLCLAGGADHDCVFTQRNPDGSRDSIPVCEIASDGSSALPEGADVCVHVAVAQERHETCASRNDPVEFQPLYRSGVPRIAGATVEATCSVSENPELECPWAR